jgi:hypothetical protein
VFEELTADEIVSMVQTQGEDVADSDECEEDDFEMPSITLAEAHKHAKVVREDVLAHPRLFSMGEMDALSGMCDVLAAGQQAHKQTTVTSFFNSARHF